MPPIPPNPSDDDRSSNDVLQLLLSAKKGDENALADLLNHHRKYLLYLANQQMDNQIQGKVGTSDIVQESMFTAQQNFAKFDGDDLGQLKAWLRQILINDVYEAARKYKGTAKRQLDREQAIQYGSRIESPLVDPGDTPKTNAVNAEEAEMLFAAMAQLPDNYQKVIQLRNWDQHSFSEIGFQMSHSEEAARKLWTRAILKLQEFMNPPSAD